MIFFSNLPIKLRLALLVGLAILTSIVIGLLGLGGMREAAHSVDKLYHVNIQNIHNIGIVTEHLEDIRNHMLLSLQHDPDYKLSSKHHHSVEKHLDKVYHDIEVVTARWKPFSSSELNPEERNLAMGFEQSWSKMVDDGVKPMAQYLKAGEFENASRLLFEVVNPNFDKSITSLDLLNEFEIKEADHAFKVEEANYETMFIAISAVLVAGALSCIVLAFFTIKGISMAVKQIKLTADALAEGDLGARVDCRAQDEMGQIAKTVNAIADTFRQTIFQVQEVINRLATAAEETSVVTTKTTAGIQEQQSETSQVATAINEMSASVQDVARNALEAASATQEAGTTFSEGKQVINQVIQAIGDLAREVGSAANVIQELEAESKNIGTVLDVIKGIAEQTNLLALNAAIEAARAGEQGRGFAVVADEVRTLAGRTQESTQEIEEMISRLQNGAYNAVCVMNNGQEMTNTGVKQAAAAGEALQTINAAVERISGMNTQIAQAAEQQSSVTEEITRSIVSINQVAEQSAVGARQISEASHELAELSEHLKGLVERFNI
jgi:methyl-accepting chemotaxis protein